MKNKVITCRGKVCFKSPSLWLLGVLAVGIMMVAGCSESAKSNKLKIVATTGMIADMVSNVGGDLVSVKGLMGPGVDPHLYRASEHDVTSLYEADIIFFSGLHLEAKMGDILKKMGDKKPSIAIAETLPTTALLTPPAFQGFHDPHVWFDVSLWEQTMTNVTQGLIARDPKNEATYTANALAYSTQLKALHQWTLDYVSKLPVEKRILVTAHDAFGYFGKAYGFHVVGLQGISTESKAGTKDIQNLASYIVKKKIVAVFVESSIPKRTLLAVQAAVKAKGWDIKIGGELFSDALGPVGSEGETYIGMVKHNVETIVNALGEGETHEN